MPAPTPVRGITELSRAFALAGQDFHRDKNLLLRDLARPVAKDAEQMALAQQVGVSWSRMRTGANPVMSYVAPVNRGTRIRARKRRNFASFLIGTAMEPALNANRASINRRIDQLVERLTRRWNRG
jgi:hypothetical protein